MMTPNVVLAGSKWYATANLASIHFHKWDRQHLNQFNPGIGVTYQMNEDWNVTGGEYLNSYKVHSWYAAIAYQPVHFYYHHWHLDIGGIAGVALGYKKWQNPVRPLMGGGEITLTSPHEFKLNLMVVPEAFIGFQLAVPL